jgi:hypothetical protein
MKNNTSKNKTGNGNNATAALAKINAEIEALNQQRVALAEPLKSRYTELRGELVALETEIRSLDGEWKPEPTKAKAETQITEILTAKGQPMTADEIVAAVGDVFTPWKVKNTLKKKSTGAKAVFALNDGRYSVKAAA